MTRVSSPRTARLAVAFDLAIVLIYVIFLWAPWFRIDSARTVDAISSSANMAWLALPIALASHGFYLGIATVTVTISALVAAALGALLSIAARMRAGAALCAVGAFLFGCSVAILMPPWTAVCFLGALLLVVALRARFVAMSPMPALFAALGELWPLGYAAGFSVLAWRYNPQLLLKVLVIAFGASLIARAGVPSHLKPVAER